MLNEQSIRVLFSNELFVDKTYCFNYRIIGHRKTYSDLVSIDVQTRWQKPLHP